MSVSPAALAYASRQALSPLMLVRLNVYWLGLSLLWGGFAIVYLPDRVEMLVGPDIKGTMLGVITAVGVTAAIIVQPLAGGISDRAWSRWGRRRPMLILGALCTAVFVLLMSLTATYLALLALILCQQIAENFSRAAIKGVLPDLVGTTQMARASSINGILNIGGTVIGATIAGMFLDAGNPGGFVFVGGLTVAFAGLLAFLVIPRGPTGPPEPQPPLRAEFSQVISYLKAQPAFVRVVASRLVFFGAILAADNTLLFNLRDRLQVENPGQWSSILLGLLLLATIASAWPAGVIGDRFGRKTVVYVACTCGLVGSVCAAAIVHIAALGFAVVMLGFALGAFSAGDWALLIDKIPNPNSAGLYLGLANFAGAGGDAVGTLWAGIALDLGNRGGQLHGFTIVYLVMALLMIAAALILRPLQDDVALLKSV